MDFNIKNMLQLRTFVLMLLLGGVFISCESDLDVTPEDDDELLADGFFENEGAYKQALAGVYANLSLTSINDPGGSNIAGLDAGTGQYIRGLFNLQNLSTDEVIWTYENDPGLRGMQRNTWSSDNPLILGVFARASYEIALANEFLRQTTTEALSGRGESEELKATIQTYRAEARVLRALANYHLLDMFGKAPSVTENDAVGFDQVPELVGVDLFNFIESELLAALPDLIAARQNEYARVDQGVANMLLAKLYLNAEVYTGTARYADCITVCETLIGSGYSLTPNYLFNFMADNNTNGAQNEIIFPISNDGTNTQNYGGTTIIIQGEVGVPENNGESLGVNATGFGGLFRVRPEFSRLFTSNPLYRNDSRNTLITADRTEEINNVGNTAEGYIITKFSNRTSTGGFGSDRTFTDTDYPLFRYADVLLMYAEATLRGGGGSTAQALGYINELRERAFGNTSGNITQSQLTLDFILDERSRELYWESHRRQDLIRFGVYSGSSYLWSYKGGPQTGTAIPQFRELFPIPNQSLSSNANLTQNAGY
ncbi:SusD-like starch-binding protein associating with outer membrane [Leeuwenhoekiella aequorea]|uniref:SusD-like starch-binding protein associating with outer membrane n=2 Tax=Leeuwenhoekiella aequorea TaxID=283736 RepID=A0A4Q0P9D5_9FLAO|nr:SusD-like starch-binding protein associating with outer membrane [Leeuwenhoekiella aequorea]